MKILAIIRDVVAILGVLTICAFIVGSAIHARTRASRTTGHRANGNRRTRRGIQEDEIAIEYQKLGLMKDLIAAEGVDLTAVPVVPSK